MVNQATTTYTYDALNHLIGVSMPRQLPGGNVVTQTRTFNYVWNNSITAYLQSATNPENGTVSYAYYSDGTLFSKTDAKGQTLKYARDSYGRVLTVSVAGSPDTVLRTYTYDTNSVDNTFSHRLSRAAAAARRGISRCSSRKSSRRTPSSEMLSRSSAPRVTKHRHLPIQRIIEFQLRNRH